MLGIKNKKKIDDNEKIFFKGQWKAVEEIGAGSYGKVYKSKRDEFGLNVYSAIKQIEIPQSKYEINNLKTEGMTQKDITTYYEQTVKKWLEEINFMSIFKDSQNIVNIEDFEPINVQPVFIPEKKIYYMDEIVDWKNGLRKEYNDEGKLEYEGEYLYQRKWHGRGYDENNNIIYELNNGNGKCKRYI